MKNLQRNQIIGIGLLLVVLLLIACEGSETAPDGDAAVDGDQEDGDPLEEETTDGDLPDGDEADGDGSEADGDSEDGDDSDGDLDLDDEEEQPLPDPTYWTPEATVVVDDLNFVKVDGKPFFAIGFDTGSGDMYDGVTGPGECNRETGVGYVSYQVEKNQAAAEAGANFAYVWSYGALRSDLVNVDPPFKGIWHHQHGTNPPPEDDVVPILYNAYGEEDMGNSSEANALRMRDEFEQFRDRRGMYAPEVMPTLPAYDDLPWYAWHPTHRMIGTGTGERLSSERATLFAQATNMMIGDWYTYIENRFDRSTPEGEALAVIFGQKGDIGEGYDDWLETDDADHRELFSAAWLLGRSLVTRRNPEAVVWLWLQGYAFSESINRSICEGVSNDSYTTGPFPSERYLRKEIASTIAAGGTGFILFGWFMNRWPEVEKLLTFFRALSHSEVYEPVLTSPRLDIGVDTTYLGEEGHDGLGRIHALVKWHEATRTAYLVVANPGARETNLELTFPWTLEKAEVLDWDAPGFVVAPTDLRLWDRRLRYVVPKDEGVILRLTPLMPESAR